MEGKRNSAIINRLGESWADMIGEEFTKPYMRNVGKLVANQRKVTKVYPPKDQVFRAFHVTPYINIRVVILGQDPYHNGHADGLAFSSTKDTIPASLRIIFEEIANDLGFKPENNADLTRWATQGVFMTNTALTVRAGDAGSHSGIGWEKFIGQALKLISLSPVPTVFMLWGRHAQSFRSYIDEDNHLILTAPHPASEIYTGGKSGFYGCKHFSKANKFLTENKLKSIQWK